MAEGAAEGGPATVPEAESGPGLLIGEFARRCRLPVSTLRYYADVGLLLPAEVDPDSGYRRYRAEQIDQAILLSRLRTIGVSQSAMRTILAGGEAAADALLEERQRVRHEMAVRQRALAEIDQLLGARCGPSHHEPVLVDVSADTVATLRVHSESSALTEAVTRGIVRLRRHLRDGGAAWHAPFGAVFPLDFDNEVDATVFVRAAVSAPEAPVVTSWLPAGRAAQVVHEGTYDSLPHTHAALLAWIAQSGNETAGCLIEEYLSLGPGPDGTTVPRTRLVVPLSSP